MTIVTGRTRIMAVDDEPQFLELIRAWLGRNYDLTTLSSGSGLLEALSAVRPDLLILDVNMPGVSGIELCAAVRADPRFKTLPVLFLTGSRQDVDLLKAFQAGATSFLGKPVTGRKLEFSIQQILRPPRKSKN